MAAELPPKAHRSFWPLRVARFLLAGIFTLLAVGSLALSALTFFGAFLARLFPGPSGPPDMPYSVSVAFLLAAGVLLLAAIWTR